MYKQLITFFCLAIFLLGFSVNAHAGNACVAAASGAWEATPSTTYWTGCGSTYPHSADTVSIGNFQMTIPTGESDAATSLTFTASGGRITITSTGSLTLSGAITVNNLAGASLTATLAGTGIISAASVVIGSGVNPTSTNTFTTDLVSTITTFTLSSGVTMNGYKGTGARYNNPELEIQAGTLSAASITTSLANATNTALITMATGAETGTLDLSAASPWVLSGTGTSTTTLTYGTVDYTAATGGQTVLGTTYDNLTLSNTSGTDTAGAAVVVTGTLTTSSGGTLDMSTYALTVTTVNDSGTVQTECTANPPLSTGKTWGGTVYYDSTAANQTVSVRHLH